ncbi:MAG: methyltransferase family protein [Thermodesulfobacteriota bacterium]
MMKILNRLDIPPVYLFLSILAMLILHFSVPLYQLIPSPYKFTGILIIALAVWVIVKQADYFDKHDTPIRPFEESTFLIREGLYQYSRNPIYLCMVVILFGSSILLGSVTPFLIVPIFFLLIQKNFVEKEEEFLSVLFGRKYIDYKNSVRRWF